MSYTGNSQQRAVISGKHVPSLSREILWMSMRVINRFTLGLFFWLQCGVL
jgi:hypothetical protein